MREPSRRPRALVGTTKIASRACAGAMTAIHPDAERALRRSRTRLRVLLTLASVGSGYVGQLARMTGVPAHRVRGCLLGDEPYYRVGHSLVPLGLAREVATENGRHYEITTRGLRFARSFAKRLLRTRKVDGAAQLASAQDLRDPTT